jgi:hypothetical protein
MGFRPEEKGIKTFIRTLERAAERRLDGGGRVVAAGAEEARGVYRAVGQHGEGTAGGMIDEERAVRPLLLHPALRCCRLARGLDRIRAGESVEVSRIAPLSAIMIHGKRPVRTQHKRVPPAGQLDGISVLRGGIETVRPLTEGTAAQSHGRAGMGFRPEEKGIKTVDRITVHTALRPDGIPT